MKQNHKKLMDQAISYIDWDSVLRVHEAFKLGVGLSNIIIPGIRRKEFDSIITVKDLKSELRCIVRYMVENDVPYLHYSNWIVSWTSDLWDFSIEFGEPIDGEDLDEDMIDGEFDMGFRPKLEILYCPQRITLLGDYSDVNSEENIIPQMTDDEKLEMLLKKALESENYEQASKVRDLIKSKNKKSGRDK